MEAAGLVLMLPCSIGALMALGGVVFKYPPLKWIGVAIFAIAWVTVFLLILTDKTYAEYETRRERLLSALDLGGVRYPLFSIGFAICVVVGIPVAIMLGLIFAVWKCLPWSRCRSESAA